MSSLEQKLIQEGGVEKTYPFTVRIAREKGVGGEFSVSDESYPEKADALKRIEEIQSEEGGKVEVQDLPEKGKKGWIVRVKRSG